MVRMSRGTEGRGVAFTRFSDVLARPVPDDLGPRVDFCSAGSEFPPECRNAQRCFGRPAGRSSGPGAPDKLYAGPAGRSRSCGGVSGPGAPPGRGRRAPRALVDRGPRAPPAPPGPRSASTARRPAAGGRAGARRVSVPGSPPLTRRGSDGGLASAAARGAVQRPGRAAWPRSASTARAARVPDASAPCSELVSRWSPHTYTPSPSRTSRRSACGGGIDGRPWVIS